MASPWGEGFSPNRCLQNNDCFVPKPLRFKCLRILPLFCVICARRKNASAFSALLVVIPSVSEESPGKAYQQISSRPSGRLFLFPPLLTIHLLIVVIAIMAILAAVLVPTVTNKIDDANKSAAKSDIQSAAKAISLYVAENESVTRAAIEALPEVAALSDLAGSYTGAITYDPAAASATATTETVMTITLKKGDDTVDDFTVEVKLGKGI